MMQEISVNNVKYRRGDVPGDNDCGSHSLNAVFPDLMLNRQGILDLYRQIINNPAHPDHKIVSIEIANELVQAIMNTLQQRMMGQNEAHILPNNHPFVSYVTTDFESAKAAGADIYTAKAAVGPKLLIEFAEAVLSADRKHPSLSASANEEGLGSLGLLCRLYKKNLILVNFNLKAVSHFSFGGEELSQAILFRWGHFSPLCLMDDIVGRERLATHHINTMIFPRLSTYKAAESIEGLRILRQTIATQPMPAQKAEKKTTKLLDEKDFAGRDDIEDQMRRAIAESLKAQPNTLPVKGPNNSNNE
jgi:hypothetical protein